MHIRQIGEDKSAKAKYFKSSSYCPENIFASTTKNFEFGFSLNDQVVPTHDTISQTVDESVQVNYYYLPHNDRSKESETFSFNFDIDTEMT